MSTTSYNASMDGLQGLLNLPSTVSTLRDELRDGLRAGPRRRKVVVALLLGAFLWFGLHALHQSLWSYRYWKVDPWALESPVQWPVVGQHARRLEATAAQLQSCLEPDAKVAVGAPKDWQGQGFYLFMWLAYGLPEQHVIPIIKPEDIEQADVYLDYLGDGEPGPPPPGLELLCHADRIRVYARAGRP